MDKIRHNLLISVAIGDIAGSVYEGRHKRTKDYNKVKVFANGVKFTDDTVLTFACAEAFLFGIDMKWNLIEKAKAILPEWMVKVSDTFDEEFAKRHGLT